MNYKMYLILMPIDHGKPPLTNIQLGRRRSDYHVLWIFFWVDYSLLDSEFRPVSSQLEWSSETAVLGDCRSADWRPVDVAVARVACGVQRFRVDLGRQWALA